MLQCKKLMDKQMETEKFYVEHEMTQATEQILGENSKISVQQPKKLNHQAQF